MEGEDGQESFQKAVVQGGAEAGCDTCYVQYLEVPEAEEVEVDGDVYERGDVLRLSQNVYPASLDSLNNRWQIDDSTPQKMMACMRGAGLMPLAEEGGDLQFFEVWSDDEDDDGEDLADFIVGDEEPFALAPSTSDFVNETHQAVREFEQWQPEPGSTEARIKQFVQTLEGAAHHASEEARYSRGQAPETRYNHPPTQ